jgi:hypothetical protein
MRFQRPATVDRAFGGIDGNGYSWYTATPVPARTDFFVGDGSAAGYFALPVAPATYDLGSLPTDCVFEQTVRGIDQIFVACHVIDFGAAGLNSLDVLIEFQDPDGGYWFPSRESDFTGVGGIEQPLRTAALANQAWTIARVGNYLLASRKENQRHNKFRVRCLGNAATDAATDIRFYWYTNSVVTYGATKLY